MRAFSLILWIALCQAVGLLGARWTAPEIGGWYRTLAKPSFNPPGWVFGPVWTTLYLLMAIAAWRVWESDASSLRTTAIGLFVVQLGLNLAWSYIFFRLHATRGAFVEIVVLWLAIAATTALFFKIDIPAAALMLPYLAWVAFASVLNGSIARLN